MSEDVVGKEFQVLDHGHVVLVDYMGSDEAILQAARTSYQKGTKQTSDDRTLLRYLMRHSHTSPFECCTVKLHVKLPIFVERQWARHRTAGWNEVSARYSELPEEYYVPEDDSVQMQSKTNKQGREEQVGQAEVDVFKTQIGHVCGEAFTAYRMALGYGVARELSRCVLPVNVYTEKVWWINLHNLLHFLSLRMDSHAQKEIRDYATIIGEQIVAKLFPLVWEAFNDYDFRRGGLLLSALDVEVIQTYLEAFREHGITQEDFFRPGTNVWLPEDWQSARCRERDECIGKLKRLGIVR